MAVGIKRIPGRVALYPDSNILRAEGQQKTEAAIIPLMLPIQTLLQSGLSYSIKKVEKEKNKATA